MNKRALLIILVSIVLVAAGVFAVQVIRTESAPSATTLDPVMEERLAGSDNIFLHPPVPLPANYYVGSDWIERHPTADVPVNYFTVATPLPANYYTGSDWIERHPTADVPVNYYTVATPLPEN